VFSSTITQKGQVTIPKKIRDALNLKPNDQVVFVRRGDSIILKPVKEILSLRGSIKVKQPQEFSKIRIETQHIVSQRIADE